MTISNSEIYIMDIIWANQGSVPAKEIASTLQKQLAWSKTTVYTMIKRLIDKKAIERIDPGFICNALCEKKQIREEQTKALIDRLYDGSLSTFVEEYLIAQEYSPREATEIKRLIKTI